MIAHIQGILSESSPLRAVIDVQGVGYDLHIPLLTAEKLPPTGSTVKLLTHLVVREDAHVLFGFYTSDERSAFIALTEKVSGIGPKTALSILSRFSPANLRSAIVTGDVAALTKCPGIGKKTAERLILELRDVFSMASAPGSGAVSSAFGAGTPGQPSSPREDAMAALITLGFKPADAAKRVETALLKQGNDASAESLIRIALAQ